MHLPFLFSLLKSILFSSFSFLLCLLISVSLQLINVRLQISPFHPIPFDSWKESIFLRNCLLIFHNCPLDCFFFVSAVLRKWLSNAQVYSVLSLFGCLSLSFSASCVLEYEKDPKTKEKAGLGYLAFKEVSGHTLALMDTP